MYIVYYGIIVHHRLEDTNFYNRRLNSNEISTIVLFLCFYTYIHNKCML